MSCESCLIFCGVRFKIEAESEIEALELRTHKLFQEARTCGMDCYWANFGAPGEIYYAFLGKILAVMGVENLYELSLSLNRFVEISDLVTKKLKTLGYSEEPKLYIQWNFDE